MTNKTKAAIEEAAKLPTAEETLQIAYDTIKANQSSDHKDVDPVLLHAIESHTQAHTEGLRERLGAENQRLREALERAYNDFKSSRWTEETYKIVIEALKNNEG